MPAVQYRHPTESDVAAMAAVWNDSRRDSPVHKTITLTELKADTFGDGDYDPEGAWLALVEGSAVAYSDGFVDKTRRKYGKNDGFVSLEAAHSSRGSGIEAELLDKALAYLRGRGVESAQGWAEAKDLWKVEALGAAGFREVRRFYMMRRMRGGRTEDPKYPLGIETEDEMVTGSSHDAIRDIVDVRNESFFDHYNFSPATVDRWQSMIKASEESHHVTFAKAQGRAAGFVLSEDRVAYSNEAGVREGWVMTLGVVKEHRRQGLGRALLCESINWLTGRGVEMIRLGVDAENQKALDLYTSVGFEVESESLIMTRSLKD